MKKYYYLFLFLAFLCSAFVANAQTPDANNILYVNAAVTGSDGSGNSWENAIPQLADALKYARQQYDANNAVYDATPLKIYVAKGTYKPLYSARNNYYTATDPDNERDNAFVMVKNVQVYGGFDPANNIDDLTDTRIFGTGGSILSGAIGDSHDDDNNYHVVISSNNVGNALLDGFTITKAYSNEATSGFITVNIYPVERTMGAVSLVRSSPSIANCTFTMNKTAFSGGGIANYQQSSPTITNCIFDINSSQNGGAISNTTNCSPTITNCSFTGNGFNAIYNSTNSSPVITNCSFTENDTKYDGGAIYNLNSSPVITNCLFANNSANGGTVGSFNGNGGAVYNSGTSSPVLTNVSIANNLGANAIYSTGTGSTTFYNSIVFGAVSATYTAQYSLIEGNTDFTNGNIAPTGITKADVFSDNTNGDYTLFPCSAVADKGNNSLFAGLDDNTKDLAGNSRLIKSTIDMGAYESQPVTPDANGIVYVTATGAGTRNGSSWSNATTALQCAINATGTQKVYVATGNYNVGANSFVMKNGIEIYGGFDPGNGIVDLDDERILPNYDTNTEGAVLNGQNTRPLIWNFNNGVTNSAVLDGFTLKNGTSANGGGIYNSGASPTLRNLWIKENTATSDGGGIYNINSSSPEMTNVTISGNTASYAGGIFNRNSSSPVITNVVIKNNTANNDGGGMYNDVSASPEMTNVSITGNSAQNGGAIYNRTNSSPVITNALIANNTATTNGGAIRNEAGSSPVLTNVTIANNDGTNALYATDGSTSFSNSIVYGGITGTYTAQYSLIQGATDTDNGNIDATGITLSAIFTDAVNADYTLLNTSTALNAGSNALFTGLDANTKDLAGNPRVYDFNNSRIIDLGAYEYQGNPATLPVTLISFTAKANGNYAQLQWQTASESNNKGFEIYRSSSDGMFVKIGEVQASHILNLTSQTYTFTDKIPHNGNNYYKLLQVDNDGTTTELGVRTLSFQLSDFSLQLFPNPAADILNISFKAGMFSRLELIDMNGKVLQQTNIESIETGKVLYMGDYSVGIYFVTLVGKSLKENRKVVKN